MQHKPSRNTAVTPHNQQLGHALASPTERCDADVLLCCLICVVLLLLCCFFCSVVWCSYLSQSGWHRAHLRAACLDAICIAEDSCGWIQRQWQPRRQMTQQHATLTQSRQLELNISDSAARAFPAGWRQREISEAIWGDKFSTFSSPITWRGWSWRVCLKPQMIAGTRPPVSVSVSGGASSEAVIPLLSVEVSSSVPAAQRDSAVPGHTRTRIRTCFAIDVWNWTTCTLTRAPINPTEQQEEMWAMRGKYTA